MQVLTSYEEGVYAVLFSSVPDEDVKPEWLERARARTQRVRQAGSSRALQAEAAAGHCRQQQQQDTAPQHR